VQNNGKILTAKGKELLTMPNIKPISDLRNYNEVLRDIAIGEPVFLTKNGRGKFAIIDINEYEKMKASLKLLSQLARGEQAGKEEGWLTIEELETALGIENV
jgi:prevent-host-death family protein